MVQGIKATRGLRGVIARFGKGTVKVKQYLLKGRFGGQVELTTCPPTEIGEDPNNGKSTGLKVVLDFSNVQSLDVVIERLQDLRKEMVSKGGSRV